MRAILLLSLALLGGPAPALAAKVAGSKQARTVMVQLFEWPWSSVAEECERVLGPGGFAAVQVSPPTEHVSIPGGPWWERYQPVSHRLESRSGGEKEFGQMVKRCAQAGVDVYADVVLNHMAGRAEGVGFAGSSFQQYEYPGLFRFNDFHHCGRNGNDDIRDFTNLYELQNCELLNLADLDTASPSVQSRLADLLNRLLGLGVAGFRVDAAKHMSPADIAGIFSRVTSPFYAVHELILSPGEPVFVGDYVPLGDVNVFPYAYEVGAAFLSGNLFSLADLPLRLGVRSNDAVIFLENHDLERRPPNETVIPYVKYPKLNQLALVYMLTWPYGYPQLYSGYDFRDYDLGPPQDKNGRTLSPLYRGECQAPWTCAHRQPDVLALVNFRNRTNVDFRATDIARPKPGLLAYGRGSLGHVVINASGQEEVVTVKTRLRAGAHCNILGGCAEKAVVDGAGNLTVRLAPQSAFVILNSLNR